MYNLHIQSQAITILLRTVVVYLPSGHTFSDCAGAFISLGEAAPLL
jgi:hypothetical protein